MHSLPKKSEALTAATGRASSEVTQEINQGFNMSNSTEVQVSSQPVFSFGEHKVRVVVRDGEPWFVAVDVALTLGYRNAPDAARHLDDDEKGTQIVRTPGGDQKVTVINESGLYALVLRSRKPEARKFAKWVTSEVLPAIRKTGVYVGKPFTVNPGDVLTAEEQNTLRLMLKTAVERLPKEKQAGAMVQGWSKLKKHFGVSYREIPRQEFSEAVSIIARHTAEWELVDDAPAAGTLNETVAHLVMQVEAPNGVPAEIFTPLVDAVMRKLGKPAMDPTDAPAMAAARKVALDYFDSYRAAVKDGKTWAEMDDIPSDALQGMIASAIMSQRMLVSFDYGTGRMCSSLIPGDSSVVSFKKDDYREVASRIPMERIPEMLEALSQRVGCHLGAFSERLQRDRETFRQVRPGVMAAVAA